MAKVQEIIFDRQVVNGVVEGYLKDRGFLETLDLEHLFLKFSAPTPIHAVLISWPNQRFRGDHDTRVVVPVKYDVVNDTASIELFHPVNIFRTKGKTATESTKLPALHLYDALSGMKLVTVTHAYLKFTATHSVKYYPETNTDPGYQQRHNAV